MGFKWPGCMQASHHQDGWSGGQEHRHWTLEQWKPVLWSDKSRFLCFAVWCQENINFASACARCKLGEGGTMDNGAVCQTRHLTSSEGNLMLQHNKTFWTMLCFNFVWTSSIPAWLRPGLKARSIKAGLDDFGVEEFKGIVNPKMSLITHPRVILNPQDLVYLLNTNLNLSDPA